MRDTALTFHHLVPRKVHRRAYFKKNFSREDLGRGINICKLCHRGIHVLYKEMHLARELNTLKALQDDPATMKHCGWVSKQK